MHEPCGGENVGQCIDREAGRIEHDGLGAIVSHKIRGIQTHHPVEPAIGRVVHFARRTSVDSRGQYEIVRQKRAQQRENGRRDQLRVFVLIHEHAAVNWSEDMRNGRHAANEPDARTTAPKARKAVAATAYAPPKTHASDARMASSANQMYV